MKHLGSSAAPLHTLLGTLSFSGAGQERSVLGLDRSEKHEAVLLVGRTEGTEGGSRSFCLAVVNGGRQPRRRTIGELCVVRVTSPAMSSRSDLTPPA